MTSRPKKKKDLKKRTKSKVESLFFKEELVLRECGFVHMRICIVHNSKHSVRGYLNNCYIINKKKTKQKQLNNEK
jgi:hypothetical protein